MLKMLSGCASAAARILCRSSVWAKADNDEINEALETLMIQRYGWHAMWGNLYHRKNGDHARATQRHFWPATSWDSAMNVAKEYIENGGRVNLTLRKGHCSPRHLSVRLLAIHGVKRPVPEILCEGCGRTERRFKKDAMADGWPQLRHVRPWPAQKMFLEDGWGYVGTCPSCGPKRSS